jgi:hypothetical protein
VNKDEILKSERLGVKYHGVEKKILISYELPEEIKNGIKSGKFKYEVKELLLSDTYTEVTFSITYTNFKKIFFFNDGFVTNSAFYTRLWTKKQSKYFNFRLQEPKYFNDYCVKRLDDFVDSLCNLLEIEPYRKELLEKEKIYYTFCKDESEVEKITGFKSKGMAFLNTDEVVTSYQTHFHEIAHILINFKLQNLGLYTLPFFMEGFAVAVGGRGGMAPRVVTDIGYYLQQTGFLTYDSIITNQQFYNYDANMTYALSGLYNTFLLSEWGAKEYLEIYEKVNGNLEFTRSINNDNLNFPPKERFKLFLNDYENEILINFNDTVKDFFEKSNQLSGNVLDKGNYFKFYVKNEISFFPMNRIDMSYQSKFFSEFSSYGYTQEQYFLLVDSIHIRVYNCYNDELISSYDQVFNLNQQSVPISSEYYVFSVNKELFEFNLYKMER